jgi:hypothetical protein
MVLRAVVDVEGHRECELLAVVLIVATRWQHQLQNGKLPGYK